METALIFILAKKLLSDTNIIEYGTRKEIIEILENKEPLVEELIRVFNDLNKIDV